LQRGADAVMRVGDGDGQRIGRVGGAWGVGHREQAVREASQTEIVKIAEHQAQDIVDDARRQARETRLEMEDWADGILSTLEVNLDKFLTAVRRGRERVSLTPL